MCVLLDFREFMLENYVCRKEDFSKCRDIVDHQKVVWTPLPNGNDTGGLTRAPSLGRASWGDRSHSRKEHNNVEQPNKAYKMNC